MVRSWVHGRMLIATCLLGMAVLGMPPGLSGQNPFELRPDPVPETNELAQDPLDDQVFGNPFEIRPESATAGAATPALLRPESPRTTPGGDQPLTDSRRYGFLFAAISILLILFAVVMTLFRQIIQRAVAGLFNDNMFGQIYREREGRGVIPYLSLYVFFFLNAGLFLTQNSFFWPQMQWGNSLWLLWGIMTGLTAAIFVLKHALLGILGYIFPLQREVRQYNFTIMLYGIVLGLFLLPANVVMAFAPEGLGKTMIYLTLVAMVVAFLFRAVRSLSISNRFLLGNKFHFLLYICTVEIAPVLVYAKLIMNQL